MGESFRGYVHRTALPQPPVPANAKEDPHRKVEVFFVVRQSSRNIYEVLSSAAEPFKEASLPGLMR